MSGEAIAKLMRDYMATDAKPASPTGLGGNGKAPIVPGSGGGEGGPGTGGNSEQLSDKTASTQSAFAPLTLSENEAAYIDELASALSGSPRRALRFINSYHLIKASLAGRPRADLEKSEYRGLLTLLAMGVVSGNRARQLERLLDTERRSVREHQVDDLAAAEQGAVPPELQAVLDVVARSEGAMTGVEKYADQVGVSASRRNSMCGGAAMPPPVGVDAPHSE